MAIQDVVQQILGVLLTYLEIAVVLVLLYMIIKLFTGSGSIGESAWNAFKDRDKDGNSSKSNSPERTTSNPSTGTGGNGGGNGTGTTPQGEEAVEQELPPGQADWSKQAKLRFIAVNMNNEPVEGVKVRVYGKPAGSGRLSSKKLIRKGETNQFGTVPMTTDGKNDWWVVPSGDLIFEYDMEPKDWQVQRALKQQARITNLFRLQSFNPFFLVRYLSRDNIDRKGFWNWVGQRVIDIPRVARGAFSDDPFSARNMRLTIAHGEEHIEPILLSFYSKQFPVNFQPIILRAKQVVDGENKKLDLAGEIH